MIQKMYLIEITGDTRTTGRRPTLLGPYDRYEDRRKAYFELRDEQGREVYTLDTHGGGEAYVGRHFKE